MSAFLLTVAALLALLRFLNGSPRVGVIVAVALAGIFFDYVIWLLFGAVAYHLLSRPKGPGGSIAKTYNGRPL